MNEFDIAKILKTARKQNGWSQEFMAEKCGLSDRTIRNMEHGQANIGLKHLLIICSNMEFSLELAPVLKSTKGDDDT